MTPQDRGRLPEAGGGDRSAVWSAALSPVSFSAHVERSGWRARTRTSRIERQRRHPSATLLDPDLHMLYADLVPHEFTHSWNGKYRRPAGLATPNYQEPMIGDLLWVYEGLTQYLGTVLAERSGLWTDEQYREALARHRRGARSSRRAGTGGRWKTRRARCRLLRMMGSQWQKLAAWPRLLSRGRTDLAGGGCDHPAADARPAFAERFLPDASTAARVVRRKSSPTRSMTWCAR